jgi:hypothetical protein
MWAINKIAETITEDVRDQYMVLREAARAELVGVKAGLTPPEVVADWFEESNGTVHELGEIIEDLRQHLIKDLKHIADVAKQEVQKAQQHDEFGGGDWRYVINHAGGLVSPTGIIGDGATSLMNYKGDGSDWFGPENIVDHILRSIESQIAWTETISGEMADGQPLEFINLLLSTYRDAYEYLQELAQRITPLLPKHRWIRSKSGI